MPCIVVLRDHLPNGAEHLLGVDGNLDVAWVRTGSGYAHIEQSDGRSFAGAGVQYDKTITEVIQDEGWTPADVPVDGDADQQGWPDEWHRTWSRVWRYWITTLDTLLPGVRKFVAAAEKGSLPSTWTEKAAEGSGGAAHTVCTFEMTMDQARSLGAEQEALMALGSLPNGVHFFQAVADIEGFTGVEKESRQPDPLGPQLFAPGDLFQTSHPDAAGQRGEAFGESDVLSVTGLTLT